MILPAGGRSDGPGRTRRGGNQGANPALALISVLQQGRRLDTTPLVKDSWAGRIRSASAARAPAGPYSDSLTHIHPRDSSCTARTR